MKQQTSVETKALPKFNQVIKIEVDVDTIHDKLLSVFPEDYKHKELLAHAIIGTTVQRGDIGYVYNALNGYDVNVNFQVGDMVMCTVEERKEFVPYPADVPDDTPLPSHKNREIREVAIGVCKVVEVNLYLPNKLLVEFEEDHRYKDVSVTTQTWVNHKLCTYWALDA